ncbi:MAG: zinc metallopeptidase [Rhodopirellula sp.]|nr:zinc metallopeptidase [Rhodopirellula sp.]
MIGLFDPLFWLMIGPAFLLGLWAQMKVKTSYASAQRMAAPLSGAAAARHVLDSAGLGNVDIEVVPGHLTDHYDPRHKVLRLSQEVYQSRSLAAVGIAAHEAGHAIQDARAYFPLVVRNAAVPLAGFGSNFSFMLLFMGAIFSFQPLIMAGIALFAAVVFFQVVNLPVEFNASSRAKEQLAALGIVNAQEMVYVNKVLSAAALTYVAATLQALLTLLYYIIRFTGNRD